MSTDTNPNLAEALDRLNARLDRLDGLVQRIDKLEALVDAFGTLAQRMPQVADAAGTTASWAWKQAEAAGVDPIAAGQQAAQLSLKLADPQAMEAVGRLLDRRDALLATADALDAIDPEDLRTVATRGAALTKNLAALMRKPEFEALIDATADPQVLSTAQSATTALVDTRSQPIEPVGAFGAFFKLGDPDVKRAVGFSLSLAKRFGQLLQ